MTAELYEGLLNRGWRRYQSPICSWLNIAYSQEWKVSVQARFKAHLLQIIPCMPYIQDIDADCRFAVRQRSSSRGGNRGKT